MLESGNYGRMIKEAILLIFYILFKFKKIMQKLKFRKMFAVMTFFIAVAVVSILAIPQAKAASSTSPSITVLSPNGGEQWEAGKNYTVRWNSTGISQDASISLNLLNRTAKTNVGSWITMVPQNTGSSDFVVPSNAEPGSSYEMLISVCSSINGQDVCADERNQYSGVEDRSDNYFSIIAASTACTDSGKECSYPETCGGGGTPNVCGQGDYNWYTGNSGETCDTVCKNKGLTCQAVDDDKNCTIGKYFDPGNNCVCSKDNAGGVYGSPYYATGYNNCHYLDITPSCTKVNNVCATCHPICACAGSSNQTKPDLTVTSIKFESPNNLKGEDGTLSVVVKNLGSDLSGTAGLLSWYNNFSAQNFVFNSATPSILSFKNDRDVLTASKPLNTNESVTFSWLGNFNTSGNIYLHFTVDNSNELDESNEKNNTLSTVIQIKENSQDTTEVVKDEQVVEIDYKAKLLNKDEFSTILSELRELRNIIKEQNAKIKYLEKLTKNVEKLSTRMESAINNFITYGVDANTQKLGEGERAAVIYSYKSAFSKLPETEVELADAIKIANGRWPSITNDEAEKKAKEQFQKIYQRIADINNANDNAAVTVMAYGLRQKAENRNLNSEKQGIKIFKNIYGRAPSSTEDWNIMQAITYSGSARGIDSDGDLLTDEREAELGTDPKKKDTDGDGFIDGIEVANGHDPLNK